MIKISKIAFEALRDSDGNVSRKPVEWWRRNKLACIDLIGKVKRIPFWKREKFWKENYEQQVLEEIINPIEKKLEEMKK